MAQFDVQQQMRPEQQTEEADAVSEQETPTRTRIGKSHIPHRMRLALWQQRNRRLWRRVAGVSLYIPKTLKPPLVQSYRRSLPMKLCYPLWCRPTCALRR